MSDRSSDARKWDLTSSIAASLDSHHMFPILDFVEKTMVEEYSAYDAKTVAAARLELLKPTNMVDYAVDIYQKVTGDKKEPAEFSDKRKSVIASLNELTERAKPFLELVESSDRRAELIKSGAWTVEGLSKCGVSADAIENYRKLGKFQYECGDYEKSNDMMDNYLSLFIDQSSANFSDTSANAGEASADTVSTYKANSSTTATLHSVLWGKLSCLILMGKYDEATVALTSVKNSIDARASSSAVEGLTALQALKERTWLLHWGLFVFWNNNKRGLDAIIDLFMTEENMQAIQTNAPHLLRYLASAIIINKRKRPHLKDLVKFIQYCNYADPIIQFVDCLHVKFDFEGAQEKLKACETVLATDFFLHLQTKLFMEEARIFIFENYCRIHQKIDINTLSEKLSMEPSEAERWIVNLIRNASLDAKIDSTENCVIMGHSTHSVYQQVINKTKDLMSRSNYLAGSLKNAVNDMKNERDNREAATGEA